MREVTWRALVFRERTEPCPHEGRPHAHAPRWSDPCPGEAGTWLGGILDHELVVQGLEVDVVLRHLRAIVLANLALARGHGRDLLAELEAKPTPPAEDVLAEWDRASEVLPDLVFDDPGGARITLRLKKTERVLTWPARVG